MPIIQNAVKITEDGKDFYLISTHVHDFAQYVFKSGRYYAVDGGNEYLRRAYNINDDESECIKLWCLSEQSSLNEICQKLLWGTYGKNGDEPLKYVPLASLTKAHLKNILKTQPQIKGGLTEKVIKRLLKKS
jgi:hypothetical protein